MVPDLCKNNQYKLMKKRVPHFEWLDPKDYDSIIKEVTLKEVV